ncbi:MAG: M3 family metallopeptidase [Nannocystales bacterium]
MGRAPRDDRAQGLSEFVQRLPAAIEAAKARFEQETLMLARAPRGFAAGFAAARTRLLAPVDGAEHEASVRGTAELSRAVRDARQVVDEVLSETLADPALLRTLERDAPEGPQWLQLRRDFEDAGARLDLSHRRRLPALDRALRQQTRAFSDHAATGPSALVVRARLRAQTSTQQREHTWAAFHNHASAAAHLPLEILRLRAERARLLGFPNYAAWVRRDAVGPEHTSGWLETMAQAARAHTKTPSSPAPWDRHTTAEPTPGLALRRDVVVEKLRTLLQGLVPSARVEFDVTPRPGKRPGAWTHVPLAAQAAITICASLPGELDLAGLRTLLHEVGHAAEALTAPGGLRLAPNALEFSSTMLEPFTWHAPTVAELAEQEVDQRVLSEARRARWGGPALRQLALAYADRALHTEFNPNTDGSPLPWARRVYEQIEGTPRDPRDATVATHMHLFAHPHGYAARYETYPLGDALAEHRWAHGPHSLAATLSALRSTLWTPQGRSDPLGALSRLTGAVASPAAFVRAAGGRPSSARD